jgi:hypothetical protein
MRIALAMSMVLGLIGSAQSQQVSVPARTYTFTVTPDEANTTLNKLGELPWKEVNPLLQKLIAQINAQNTPPTLSEPSAPKQD